jgi:hypothetical protein
MGGRFEQRNGQGEWIFPLSIYTTLARHLTSFPSFNVNVLPNNVLRVISPRPLVLSFLFFFLSVALYLYHPRTSFSVLNAILITLFLGKVFLDPRPPPPQIDLERIPVVLLNSLLPFQRKGVEFAVRKNGRCLIGDEMGLGVILLSFFFPYLFFFFFPSFSSLSFFLCNIPLSYSIKIRKKEEGRSEICGFFGFRKTVELIIGTLLGKTIQAIAVCAYYMDEWPILIITPSSLIMQWAEVSWPPILIFSFPPPRKKKKGKERIAIERKVPLKFGNAEPR